MEREKVVIVPPVSQPEKTLTGALNTLYVHPPALKIEDFQTSDLSIITCS